MHTDIDFIKQTLSITEVALRLGLNPVRGRAKCIQPQRHSHGDRTPSMSINESKGIFNCWVCNDVRGDVIALVSQSLGIGFKDALRWIFENFPETKKAISQNHFAPIQKPTGILSQRNLNSSIEKPLAPSMSVATMEKVQESRSVVQLQLIEKEEHWREKAILAFLKMLVPIDDVSTISGDVRKWLMARKIYLKTWQSMRLRYVHNYGKVNDSLRNSGDQQLFQEIGILNEHGNLRFYKHPLILPYLDQQNRPLHFQARAIDSVTTPKELSLRGTIPCPYNVKALDGRSGLIYLCEGPIDTLTLIDKKVPAVGVPGVSHLKAEWIPLFEGKKVIVCFDNDEAGRKAQGKVCELFADHGIDASPLKILPDGTDINDWFVRI